MKIKIRTEVKVGFIAILAIVTLIWGFNFLKGKDLFKQQNTYFVVYKNLSGLQPSSSVFINGLKVGRVKKIVYNNGDLSEFILQFEIHSDIKLPQNSFVRVFSGGILDAKSLEIVMGDAATLCKDGDTIRADYSGKGMLDEVAEQIKPIKDKAEALLGELDTVVTAVKVILNKQTQANLIQTLSNINTMSSRLSSASVKLDGLIDSEKAKVSTILSNAESISANLKQNNQKLSNAITNFSNISDTLAQANLAKTLQDANIAMSSLSDILKKINNGKGNMGMLVNNDSLYLNMERSMKNLDLLITDIQKNPKRYVRVSVF